MSTSDAAFVPWHNCARNTPHAGRASAPPALNKNGKRKSPEAATRDTRMKQMPRIGTERNESSATPFAAKCWAGKSSTFFPPAKNSTNHLSLEQ